MPCSPHAAWRRPLVEHGLIDRIAPEIDHRGYGLWALEVIETGKFIGFTGLSVPSFEAHFTPAVEIGWRLPKDAWGNGYATEAALDLVHREGTDVRRRLAEPG